MIYVKLLISYFFYFSSDILSKLQWNNIILKLLHREFLWLKVEQLRSNWGQKEKKFISSAHDLVIRIAISSGYPQSVKPNPGPSVYLGKITKGFASKSPDTFFAYSYFQGLHRKRFTYYFLGSEIDHDVFLSNIDLLNPTILMRETTEQLAVIKPSFL